MLVVESEIVGEKCDSNEQGSSMLVESLTLNEKEKLGSKGVGERASFVTLNHKEPILNNSSFSSDNDNAFNGYPFSTKPISLSGKVVFLEGAVTKSLTFGKNTDIPRQGDIVEGVVIRKVVNVGNVKELNLKNFPFAKGVAAKMSVVIRKGLNLKNFLFAKNVATKKTKYNKANKLAKSNVCVVFNPGINFC